MVLAAGDIALRPFGAGDEEAVLAMLREPEVARWWPAADFERDALAPVR